MSPDPYSQLSARERQMMDAVYQLETATAVSIHALLPDPPTNATVRSTLRVLEEKGWLEHTRIEGRFVYRPTRPRASVRRSLLRHVVNTFYDGSPADVVAGLLGGGKQLDAEEKERIRALLEEVDREEDQK